MPEKYFDIITILLLTAVPLLMLLLHIFLSTRSVIFWSFLVPILWSSLGAWMIAAGYENFGFSRELFIFYLIGDVILFLVTLFLRKRIKRKQS